MERHEDASSINPNVYPQELQLKLYQAFIFSIPILFSIILFLLFYLFYLKRRASNNNMSSQNPLSSANRSVSSFISPPWTVGIKGELKDKLQVVQFDDELQSRESLCCVCLGEFEMKEELQQLPLCKHVFHGDCIRLWLRANATCPLCRCPLISAIKMGLRIGLVPSTTHLLNSNPALSTISGSSVSSSHEHVVQISESSSSNTIPVSNEV